MQKLHIKKRNSGGTKNAGIVISQRNRKWYAHACVYVYHVCVCVCVYVCVCVCVYMCVRVCV